MWVREGRSFCPRFFVFSFQRSWLGVSAAIRNVFLHLLQVCPVVADGLQACVWKKTKSDVTCEDEPTLLTTVERVRREQSRVTEVHTFGLRSWRDPGFAECCSCWDHVRSWLASPPGGLEVGDQVVRRPHGRPQRAQQRGARRPRGAARTQVRTDAREASGCMRGWKLAARVAGVYRQRPLGCNCCKRTHVRGIPWSRYTVSVRRFAPPC